MKTTITLLVFFILPFALFSQTLSFHEDFEAPSLGDSVSNSSTPTAGFAFAINTRMHSGPGSLQCDSCQVKTSNTVYLTTSTFSTLGGYYIILNFDQVCKIDFTDNARIEVSADNGITWTQLTGAHYLGTGQFAAQGNKFAANSYGSLWNPSTISTLPQNTWWKTEAFNVSALLGNCAAAKVRFLLSDGGMPGPNANKGWYLDNIKITQQLSELIPPVITMSSQNPAGLVFSQGPFTIKAKISDASGIDTAYLVYSLNNGYEDTIGMTPLTNDTMMAIIPLVANLDEVCWHIEALDNSVAHNWVRNPVTGCNFIKAVTVFTLPYADDFDGPYSYWIPSFGGSNQNSAWQLGTPTVAPTNSAHSAPNAWDINLTTNYQYQANCVLTSPRFDFSNVYNAKLTFWLNYSVLQYYDGTYLDYTTNGSDWYNLGTIGDTLATNWYNFPASGINCRWTGNSNGWKKSTYILTALNNSGDQVRFRFRFLGSSPSYPGVSMDDFSITVPSQQSAECTQIMVANGNCGMGNEAISIKIFNKGVNTIPPGFTAGFRVSPTSPLIVETVSDSVMSLDTLVFSFNSPANLLAINADSTFAVKAWVNIPGDADLGDDTANIQVLSRFKPDPPAFIQPVITYSSSTTLTVSSPYSVNWYSNPDGTGLLGNGLSYTTPVLFDTTVYYLESVAGNGCKSVIVGDTVFVSQIPALDFQVVEMTNPSSGLNLSAKTPLKVRLKNNGSLTIANPLLSYQIDNQTWVTDTVNLVFLTGDTLLYVFKDSIDLSTYTTYNIKVWHNQPGDQNQLNDTVSKVVVNSMYTYCTSKALTNIWSDIGNVSISNLNNGNPLPTEYNSSSVNVYSNFVNTITPVNLIQGQTYPVSISTIYWKYFIQTRCAVYVDWNFDGIFTEPEETAFYAYTPTSADNTIMTGYLTVPANAVLALTRFRVVLVEPMFDVPHACTLYQVGETEDYLARILPMVPIDARVSDISVPDKLYAEGFTGPLTATLKNPAINPLTACNIGYIIDNNPAVSQPWTGNLLSGTTTQISFPPISWPAGNHVIKVFVQLTGDTLDFNDTTYLSVTGIPLDTLPYDDNFDQDSNFVALENAGTTWIQGTPASQGWPGNAHSSPAVWATNLNQPAYTSNTTALLTTQAFDLSTAINARLSFWYNIDIPFDGDGVQLQYSTDLGITWTVLGGLNDPLGINWYSYNIAAFGTAWAGNSAGWKKASYLLSSLNNTPDVRFRFVLHANDTYTTKGFALDDFNLSLQPAFDAGLSSIVSPMDTASAGFTYPVTLSIKNYGTDTITTLLATYTYNNTAAVSQTWNGVLLPDSTTEVTLPGILIADGQNTIFASINMSGDQTPENDTLTHVYPCKLMLTELLTPQQWIQDHVVGLQGNVVNAAITGVSDASAKYTAACSALGLNQGILLTSGYFGNAYGPNNVPNKGRGNNTVIGDADLSNMIGSEALDVYKLEFDMIALSDSLSFRYVFGSEEYHEFIHSLNDAFGIFINGPGISGPYTSNSVNMALIPGTSDHVAVNTLNNGSANNGPCQNCQYLVDNTGGKVLQYDAYTKLMTASHAVIPGQQYHIKMVICDAIDWKYDAGVFIESGEKTGNNTTASVTYHHPENQSYAADYCLEGCSRAEVRFHKNYISADTTYIVIDSIYGTAINGLDYSMINDTILILPYQLSGILDILPIYDGLTEGPEYLKIRALTNTTYTTLTIFIHDYKHFQLSMISDTLIGPPQGQVQLWASASSGTPPYHYNWSPTATLDDPGISNPTATPQQTGWYFVEVSDSTLCPGVEDSVLVSLNGCSDIAGTVYYDNVSGTLLSNVTVALYLNNTLISSTITDSAGHYTFLNICTPGTYDLRVVCNKPWQGCNSVDALLVSQHFVGMLTLSPFRSMAGDVNFNSTISSIDALMIAKRFVGLMNSFPAGDWLFENTSFTIPANPMLIRNIRGICYGDVNGSY